MSYTFGQASENAKQLKEISKVNQPEQKYTFGQAGGGKIVKEQPVDNGVSGLRGFAVGAGKGVISSFQGASSLGEKILRKATGFEQVGQTSAERLIPKGLTEAKGTAEKVGFGTEKLAEFFIPAGMATKGATALRGLATASKLGKGATMAAKLGATGLVGAAETGGVRAIQTGGDVKETAKAAGFGAGGAIIGYGIGNAISKKLAEKSASEISQIKMLEKNIPDTRVVTKVLEKGKLVTDKAAKNAIRQGIPESRVALIKTASKQDKAKMVKMLNIRKAALTNERATARSTDIVGDTFIEKLAKPIENLNRQAGKQLDGVAKKLSGIKVDTSKPINSFYDDLQKTGIKLNKNGTLNFKNSNFEGLTGSQKLINNVYDRVNRVAKSGDALKLHQTKSYIDEIVNYGKKEAGLSGKAQNILKTLRHNIDEILDTNFVEYNKVNTQYSETINELNNLGSVLGKKFKIGEKFSDTQAGTAMRGILSNTKKRGEILQLLDKMQKVGKKYGVKLDEDIITQAKFADTLEDILGSEAPTSFLGGIERGVKGAQEIQGVASELASGRPISAAFRAVNTGLQRARGINQANQVKAIESLLKKTNFGK